MKSTPWYVILAVSLLALTGTITLSASAREVVLPAGTLLKCTLDEPNLSSATVDVGDPVLCHLHAQTEFGQQAFPRGSYLVGHLEAAKDPGHFWGKGYLKLQFDRIGLPSGDLPLEAKVIATRGYKVDKQGDIKGKGHAVRDVVEWMIPPLWPWKVIMLPARGPRPTLKGETALSLRLMDDVEIPQVAQNYGPSWHFFGRYQSDSFHDSNQRDSNQPDSYQHNSNQRDSNQNGRHPSVEMELSVRPSSFVRDSNGSNDGSGSSNDDGGSAQMQPHFSKPAAGYLCESHNTHPADAGQRHSRRRRPRHAHLRPDHRQRACGQRVWLYRQPHHLFTGRRRHRCHQHQRCRLERHHTTQRPARPPSDAAQQPRHRRNPRVLKMLP